MQLDPAYRSAHAHWRHTQMLGKESTHQITGNDSQHLRVTSALTAAVAAALSVAVGRRLAPVFADSGQDTHRTTCAVLALLDAVLDVAGNARGEAHVLVLLLVLAMMSLLLAGVWENLSPSRAAAVVHDCRAIVGGSVERGGAAGCVVLIAADW